MTCWGGCKWIFASDDQKSWLERMAANGLAVPSGLVRQDGAGMSAQEARVLDQEVARIGAKKPLENIGIWMLGPALRNVREIAITGNSQIGTYTIWSCMGWSGIDVPDQLALPPGSLEP